MKNRQRYILWMLVVIISVNLLVGVSAIFYPTVYAFTGSAALDKDVLLHPADQDGDWRLIMSETILYLLGWQQGTNTLEYAIRAAYLWQNGEYYTFDSEQTGSLRWVLQSAPPEGEQEGEVIIEGETVPASVIFTLGPAEGLPKARYGIWMEMVLLSPGKVPGVFLREATWFLSAFWPVGFDLKEGASFWNPGKSMRPLSIIPPS